MSPKVYKYNCQVCGRSYRSGHVNRCRSCNKLLCNRCNKHGLCKQCSGNLNPEDQKKLKRFSYISYAVIVGSFVGGALLYATPEGFFWGIVFMAFSIVYLCIYLSIRNKMIDKMLIYNGSAAFGGSKGSSQYSTSTMAAGTSSSSTKWDESEGWDDNSEDSSTNSDDDFW